jgi:hypothetical protein
VTPVRVIRPGKEAPWCFDWRGSMPHLIRRHGHV